MPSAAESMQHCNVVFIQKCGPESQWGEVIGAEIQSTPPLAVTTLLLTFSLCGLILLYLPFFLPCSHKEMADGIEAVASRAVSASKQTFGFLMDLLQDNSTEEYISNLTEQWAHRNQPKHSPTQTSTSTKSPIHIKHTVLQNPTKMLDSPDYCAFAAFFQQSLPIPVLQLKFLFFTVAF